MEHPNKNEILALFYHETTKEKEKQMISHIQNCQNCQEYLNELNRIGQALNKLPEEVPLPATFDMIMKNISPLKIRAIEVRPAFSIKPIMQIAFALVLILISIYFVQIKISLLPIWKSLESWRFVQAVGSFGVVTILFFCIGTFITLALTPILLIKTKQLDGILSH